jgi:Leucine-rich repeat (LRR) protein
MKSVVVIFYSSLLLWSGNLAAQPDRIFYSLYEASQVSVDSVLRLDLSKKKYTELPAEIYRYTNLKELDLSQNKLTHLPDDFYFPNLEVLNLEKNDLDTFSNSICQNTTLRQLYLGRNDIHSFPECIGQLVELVILDAWFNPIQDLPMALTTLKKLRSMDLRGITYSKEFQKKWNALLPWVKIEFDVGCDCAN